MTADAPNEATNALPSLRLRIVDSTSGHGLSIRTMDGGMDGRFKAALTTAGFKAGDEVELAMLGQKDRLWRTCQGFIDSQQITFPEDIHQRDAVIVAAYDFIEAVCEIVGYQKCEDDDG